MAYVCVWSGWFRIAEYLDEVGGGLDSHVCGCAIWYRSVLWKKFHGVRVAFGFGLVGKYSVAAVVF